MLVDVFGNLVTNLSEAALAGHKIETIQCGGKSTSHFVSTFGEASPGELVGMLDSSGWLSLCVVNNSAAKALDAKVGDQVEVFISPH
jgi:S-adenosyl-L-methionine hydrolase (adenosine-forming)